MITLIAPALLVSTLLDQQTAPVLVFSAPVSYTVEMKIYEVDESLRLNGAPLLDSMVIKPGDSALIEADRISLVSSPMIRTFEGQPAMMGMGLSGKFNGYRILFVLDEDDLLVSFRHMTWRQEKDSSVELDKNVLKAVATIMSSGGTWFIRLDDDTVVSIKITEDTSNSYRPPN